MNSKSLPMLAGLAASTIWGGMYVVSKVVLEVVPPFTLLSIRLILGFAVLAVFVAAQGGFKLAKRDALRIGFAGFVGFGVSLGLQFVGTKLSTAVNAALVTSITPVLVLPCAAILLKETIGLRAVIALVIATLGVFFVVDPTHLDLSSSRFAGNMALLGASLTWALYSVLVGRAGRSSSVLVVSAVALLGGLPLTLPAGAFEIATQGMGTITVGIVGGVLFLGIVSTALAMFLWNYAFAKLSAQEAGITLFAQPLSGVVLGWLFLNEVPNLPFFLGGLCIVAALVIVVLPKKRQV